MKILRSVLQHFDAPQSFRETLFDIGVKDLGNPDTPVEVELTANQRGEDFFLNGMVWFDLTLTCDRCLGKACCHVEGTFEVWLVSEMHPDLDADEENILIFSPRRQEVDLSGVIAGTIYTELPKKRLCREDCRGLCPACGADLNIQPCGCVTEETDERWSALMAVKHKLEE